MLHSTDPNYEHKMANIDNDSLTKNQNAEVVEDSPDNKQAT